MANYNKKRYLAYLWAADGVSMPKRTRDQRRKNYDETNDNIDNRHTEDQLCDNEIINQEDQLRDNKIHQDQVDRYNDDNPKGRINQFDNFNAIDDDNDPGFDNDNNQQLPLDSVESKSEIYIISFLKINFYFLSYHKLSYEK